MQYGELAPQEKPNSYLEVVTFPWINVSGYNFYVMNTLHEFAASSKGKNDLYLSNNNFRVACLS